MQNPFFPAVSVLMVPSAEAINTETEQGVLQEVGYDEL